MSAAQRDLLAHIGALDAREVWKSDGCRDMAEWLSGHLGISKWAARRWVHAAHALESLPQIAGALESGRLGLDKVIELCRLATPETEEELVVWAKRVSAVWIRHKADLAAKSCIETVRDIDNARFLHYWYEGDKDRFGLEASLPADDGALVAKALERLAERIPLSPADDDGVAGAAARRRHALVAMASARIAEDHDGARATVVVHADLSALAGNDKGCEIEGGAVIHPEVARKLACDARLQPVLHGSDGHAVGIGRASREVPGWLMRALRRRDRGCTFPGCRQTRFLSAHYIKFWSRGGRTDLNNLALVCHFHHKLVHKYGWRVALGPEGIVDWFRPDGRPYVPGAALTRGHDPPALPSGVAAVAVSNG